MRWFSLVRSILLPVAYLLAPCDGESSLMYECGDLLSHFNVTDEGTPSMAGGCRGLATADGSQRHFCAFCRENICDQVVIDIYSAFEPNSDVQIDAKAGAPWAYNFTLPFRPHEAVPTLNVSNTQEALDTLLCTNASFQCDEHHRHNCIASNHVCEMPRDAPARVMLSDVCNGKKCTVGVIEEAIAIASNGILVLRPFGAHVGTTERGTEIRLDRSHPSIDGSLDWQKQEDNVCTGKFTEQGVYHYSGLPILRHAFPDTDSRLGDSHTLTRHHDSTNTSRHIMEHSSEWCGGRTTLDTSGRARTSAVVERVFTEDARSAAQGSPAPVGVAFDGHIIYSPPNGTAASGLDLCNGKYDEANHEYRYFVTSHFPYWPGCFGPSSGNVSYSPSCTAKPPPNRKYPTALCSTDSDCSLKSQRRAMFVTQVNLDRRRLVGYSEEELRTMQVNSLVSVYVVVFSLVVMTLPLFWMFLISIHWA